MLYIRLSLTKEPILYSVACILSPPRLTWCVLHNLQVPRIMNPYSEHDASSRGINLESVLSNCWKVVQFCVPVRCRHCDGGIFQISPQMFAPFFQCRSFSKGSCGSAIPDPVFSARIRGQLYSPQHSISPTKLSVHSRGFREVSHSSGGRYVQCDCQLSGYRASSGAPGNRCHAQQGLWGLVCRCVSSFMKKKIFPIVLCAVCLFPFIVITAEIKLSILVCCHLVTRM
jgi:hypothetical protein